MFTLLSLLCMLSLTPAAADGIEVEARRLNDRGLELSAIQDYAAARDLFQQSFDLQRTAWGKDHVDTAETGDLLGLQIQHLGDYDAARALFERGLIIRRRVLGNSHAEVGHSLAKLAGVQKLLGEFDASLSTLEECLEIRRNAFGDHHVKVAYTLVDMATLHRRADDFTLAKLMYQEALDILRAEEDEPAIASTLNNMGNLSHRMGQFDQALAQHNEALRVRLHLFGQDHVDIAQSLHNIGRVQFSRGHYSESNTRIREGLAIRIAVLGEGHPRVATSLDELATVLEKQGDTDRALATAQRALTIRRGMGRDHTDLAASLKRVASLHMERGDFAQARPALEEALDIYCRAYGPKHTASLGAIHALARLLEHQGDYRGAAIRYEETLALLRPLLGDRHPAIATTLTNLGNIYRSQGQYEAAERAYQDALDIVREARGTEHPAVASALNSLASLRRRQQDHKAAQALFEEGLAIQISAFGDEHPDVARTLHNLGGVYASLGRSAEAVQSYERAIAMRRATRGDDHHEVATSQSVLSRLLVGLDEREAARGHVHEALANRSNALELLSVLSDREGAAYLRGARFALSNWLLAFDREDDAPLAWSHILRWKGVGTRNLAERSAASRAAKGSEQEAAWASLTSTRRELASLVYADFDADEAEERRAQIQALSDRKEAQERAMATDFSMPQAATPEAICATIPRRGALVDFLQYEVHLETHYLAMVVRSDCSVVRVELGPIEPLDAQVDGWRQSLAAAEIRAERRGVEVAKKIWSPLRAHLDDVDQLWLIPDGAMSGLPWAALPVDPDRFLVETLEIHVLSNAAQLLTTSADSSGGLLTIGGVDYGASTRSSDGRRAAPCVNGDFAPLPATLAESTGIQGWWSRHRRSPVRSLSGDQATETAMYAAAPGSRIIHLATHGFFSRGECRAAIDDGGLNPMVLSGLVLAGANAGGTSGAAGDGIVTAEEIAGLDLRGTELVLLSACETALGDTTRAGEGVLGLQRGFAIAGAGAVAMSLWSVPDAETSTLMQTLISETGRRRNSSPAAALRKAQLELLERNREAFGLARPETWAAWIVSG